MKKKLTPDVNR